MLKIFFKSPGLIVFVLLCSLVLLTGCGQAAGGKSSTDQSAENVSDLFDKVQIGQTKEEVDAVLGVTPTSEIEGAYEYLDENGNGVTVFFIERIFGDGSPKVALTKKLIGVEKYFASTPEDQRITDEQAEKITEGMTYDEVKTILGQEGIVVSVSEGVDGALETERYWIKPGLASILSVSFAGSGGSDLSTFIINF